MAKKTPTIETFPSTDGPEGYYWRLRAKNGEIIATGAEGYTRKGDALRAAKRAQKIMAEAEIVTE